MLMGSFATTWPLKWEIQNFIKKIDKFHIFNKRKTYFARTAYPMSKKCSTINGNLLKKNMFKLQLKFIFNFFFFKDIYLLWLFSIIPTRYINLSRCNLYYWYHTPDKISKKKKKLNRVRLPFLSYYKNDYPSNLFLLSRKVW